MKRVNWPVVFVIVVAVAVAVFLFTSPLPDRSLKVQATCTMEDAGAVWQITAANQELQPITTGLSIDGGLAVGQPIAGGGKLTFEPVVVPRGEQHTVHVYLRSALSSRAVAGYRLPDDCNRPPEPVK